MTPNGKKYTIQYYNALSGQLLPAYTQYNSKPELILPPLSGDASCPIVYFVVRNTSKSTNDNDTVFPAEYAKLLNENFNFFTSTEPTDVENNSNQKIIVYPNPAKDKLYIMLPNDSENNYIAQIFSIEGQLLIENEFNTDSFVMDISGLPNGIYVINIYSNRIFYTTKIIKQ